MAATKLASKTRIYLDVKQMLDIAIDVVRNFPKSQRPVFGDRLCNMLIHSLNHIANAYMLGDLNVRIEHLAQLQTNLEVISTLIDIAGEQRWIMGTSKLALAFSAVVCTVRKLRLEQRFESQRYIMVDHAVTELTGKHLSIARVLDNKADRFSYLILT